MADIGQKRMSPTAPRTLFHRLILAPRFPRIPERDDPDLEKPPEELRAKILDNYYPQLASRVAAVRSRAQGGYTIAAAIAAAIITAGALSNIDDQRRVTQIAAGF